MKFTWNSQKDSLPRQKKYGILSLGKPISDISPNIVVPDIEKLIHEVIDTIEIIEIEVKDKDGNWYLMGIRHYKTVDNKIEGVILTLFDIEVMKKNMEITKASLRLAEAIIETVSEPLIILDSHLRIVKANKSFDRLFSLGTTEYKNRFFYSIGNGEWDISSLKKLLEEIIPVNSVFENYEIDIDFPKVGRKKLILSGRQITKNDFISDYILLSMKESTFLN